MPSSSAVISRDGEKVIYSLPANTIAPVSNSWHYKDINDGIEHTIQAEHPSLGIADLFYSPITNKIYYWSRQTDSTTMALFENELAGGQERKIINSNLPVGRIPYFQVSADGKRALFQHQAEAVNQLRLIYMNGIGHLNLVNLTGSQTKIQADDNLKNIILTDLEAKSTWFRLAK